MICKVCGEDRDKFAKGMCRPCYMKEYYKNPKKVKETKCKECGVDNVPLVKGMCRSCYTKTLRKTNKHIGVCTSCLREKPIVGFGMCCACYQRARRKRADYVYTKRKTYCKICGEEAVKLSLCQKHYDEYIEHKAERDIIARKEYYKKNREHLLEKSKEHHKLHSEEYIKRAKEWSKNNPERAKAQRKISMKRWYENKKNDFEYQQKIKQKNREYYQRRRNGSKKEDN